MKTRLAAVGIAASGAAAPRGLRCGQRVRLPRGAGATGRRPPPSPARSPVRAPAPSRPRPRRGSRASRRPTRTPPSTTTPAARAPGAPSSSPAASTSRAATRTSRATRPPRPRPRCGGDVVEVPVYVSPDRGRLQPRRASQPAARRRRRSRRSSPARSRPGTTRRSPPTTRASTCPPPPITPVHRCDKSGTTAELHRLPVQARPRPTGPHRSPTRWPIQGGEAAQGTSGVVGAVKGGKGTIGYADESQAKGLRHRQGQGRRRVRRADAPRARPRSLEASQRVSDGGDNGLRLQDRPHDHRPRAPTRSCSSPTTSPARSTPTRPRPTW